MLRAIADAHTAIWYLFADPRLSSLARATIDGAAAAGEHIGFSSITLAEVVYLQERGRVDSSTQARLLAAVEGPGAVLLEIPFDRHVARVLPQVDRSQVPDMPDRIIAATAVASRVPLISRDRRIRFSTIETFG